MYCDAYTDYILSIFNFETFMKLAHSCLYYNSEKQSTF